MAYTTINKPSNYFDTKLYTGNGSTQTVTGIDFKPDLVWIKSRSTVESHRLQNSIIGATSSLATNTVNGEGTIATALTSFNSNGFSLGNDASWNSNGATFASWNWSASGTTPVSNTSGTISSSVSTNSTSRFSIISYTGNGTSGATVGHGLGVTPACYIVKCRSNSGANWSMYHQSLGNTKAMVITATPVRTSAVYWNNTSPTSNVFSLGNDQDVNTNGFTYIAYCFSEIKGFSKFGSYTGNSSNDGTFVYTGFKPAFLLIKSSTVSGISRWIIKDNRRNTGNVVANNLVGDIDGTENTDSNNYIDFLSNGFKNRGDSSDINSGQTYIYMAFAEQPLVGTNNVPCTAR
jgi:hypothetical protein